MKIVFLNDARGVGDEFDISGDMLSSEDIVQNIIKYGYHYNASFGWFALETY